MVELAILQGLQIATVLCCAPLLRGIINRLKAIVQSKHGPSIWQPYRDYWKLLHKGSVVSDHASWVYHMAPLFSFITPLVVAMLIPVLTAYPLPFAFMGDMLAGGFILSLGGFFTSIAAMDTASTFGGMGSSRSRVVSLLAEPVVILILFCVTLIAQATIPFAVNQTLISPAYLFNPAHWLLACALFMVILAESGRIPVDNPASTFELSMIEASRTIEYSGQELALMEWGGAMKFFVLLTILLNVLTAPWGLAPDGGTTLLTILIAVGTLLLKMIVICCVIVVIESSIAKWRFFRIPEFLGVALILAGLSIVAFYLTHTVA
ncbi:MAG TPA: NADH-quinone oxidoreductase subunit H [Ktedonobacteraceae bacterium]|nr:NADH-quinone oxidoreductase subunit H [Ktedonobacteraceae bacterium]